ncbi:MAG: hypothetical protein P1V81_11345 [Planctomycetota bacterium]|nr:hypothetical protein [Planctomycetota bacterium]
MTDPSSNPAADLTNALEGLGDLLAGKRGPDRFDVRAIFLPLGSLILEGDLAGLAPTLEQLSSVARPDDEAWAKAVEDELRLATDEFCSSVDPRFLGLPNYDMTYTLASREYLACRFQAAEHLGFALPEGAMERVESADKALDPYL